MITACAVKKINVAKDKNAMPGQESQAEKNNELKLQANGTLCKV